MEYIYIYNIYIFYIYIIYIYIIYILYYIYIYVVRDCVHCCCSLVAVIIMGIADVSADVEMDDTGERLSTC